MAILRADLVVAHATRVYMPARTRKLFGPSRARARTRMQHAYTRTHGIVTHAAGSSALERLRPLHRNPRNTRLARLRYLLATGYRPARPFDALRSIFFDNSILDPLVKIVESFAFLRGTLKGCSSKGIVKKGHRDN